MFKERDTQMKIGMRLFAICCAVFMIPATAGAKIKAKTLAGTTQQTASIAIDPDGFTHVAYQGTDYGLYHARFDGRTWLREKIDTNQYYGNSIAVDAQGRVHIVYGAERIRDNGADYQLMHAFYNGGSWSLTTLLSEEGNPKFNPRIALNAAGRPCVLFMENSGYRYAKFSGTSWEFEDTGLPWSWYSDGFVLDAAGHAHISYAVNYSGSFYATNASGAWIATQLSSGDAGATAINLDAAGRPRVVTAEGGALILHSFDGADWSHESMLDFNDMDPGITALLESHIAMAIEEDDRPRIMTGLYLSTGTGYANTAVFVFDNGVFWNALLVDKKGGFYPDIVLDAQGGSIVTYCGALKSDDFTKTKWARIVLPDLTGSWAQLELNGSTVTGTLNVMNQGLDKSAKTRITLWLSDDAILDDADAELPDTLRLKSLKPGAAIILPVEFTSAGTIAGRYLIAVIDTDFIVPDSSWADNLITRRLVP
jgi:hypothetical protein